MAICEFKIGDRIYQINCPEKEIEKIKEVAKSVDQEFSKLSSTIKNTDHDTKIAMMLIIQKNQIIESEEEIKKHVKLQEYSKNIVYNLSNIKKYIDQIANKLEQDK